MDPPHNPNWKILSRLIIAACLLVLLAPLSCVRADWINLTGAEISPNIAEIYVEDDRVRLVLEIYIGDIAAFEGLVPDNWMKEFEAGRPIVAERLHRFSSKV